MVEILSSAFLDLFAIRIPSRMSRAVTRHTRLGKADGAEI
jgi:hypothetical protein